MGLEDENGPPKKKLKQAQLCFANVGLKRKLSSDLSDEMQINKMVCKETEKENVETNNRAVCESNNKGETPECSSVCENVSEKSIKEKDPSDIDSSLLTISSSPINKGTVQVVCGVKEEEKSCGDFSLVISDSVLNTINSESQDDGEEKKSVNHELPSENSTNQGSNTNCFVISKETKQNSNEDLNKSLPSIEDELDKTFNSDDGSICISSEESPDTSITSPTLSNKKLTPKRIESLKRKEERERLKLERKVLRAKAKEEKLKLKQEKNNMKRKEKEEKEKRRQAELKAREDEKRLKEEERKKKEEEKKLKEEERRQKEEAKEEEKRKKEEINEKEKAAFVNFFIPKKKQLSESSEKSKESETIKFMPFPMKPDMKVAIEPRRNISCKEKEILDSSLSAPQQNSEDLYLKELKAGTHLPLKSDATWPVVSQEEEHDVIIIESTANGDCIDLTNTKLIENKKKMRAKLLQFHDNRRPPYWGTWRKKSKALGPRNPFGLDKQTFDYEVDSDSEWEDEVEGEDIDKEGDSDEEPGEEEENPGENGYVLDNTFVPHGYLSDEEVHPDEDHDDNNPENLKLRMKLLKQEFDEEMESKTERLKPRLLGCVWISNGTTEVSAGSLYEKLMRFRAVWNEDGGSIDLSGPEIEDSPTSVLQTKSRTFPSRVVPVLAKFVHENTLPLSALVREFLSILEKDHPSENVSKRGLYLKIKEIASKTYDLSGKSIWAVNPDMCKEFGLKTVPKLYSTIPSTPQPILEKPKESLLVNFLKGTHTPQPIKKRVPLTPVGRTPVKTDNETNEYKSTPRPPVVPVVKKRAQLITLPRTPVNSISSIVHQDTPRPPINAPIDTIDLSVDSP